jgi:MFS transporter, DHA3 family, macrolide efflux protein
MHPASKEVAMASVRASGMFGFSVVWFGQLVSVLGSGMTQFALTIWAWQATGQATVLALVVFFGFFPRILMTPIAGALVDRWNRKLAMMLSDLAAGIATIAIFVLLQTGHLEIWHLYAAAAFSGVFGSFQVPAYGASITLMVPKEHYTRADAMLGLVESASSVFAPIAAGALLAFTGIGTILIVDMVTFVFAVGTLLFVHVPQPPRVAAEEHEKRSLWGDMMLGFRHIFSHASLRGLLVLVLVVNITSSVWFALLSPLVLARSGGDELALGAVRMILGVGGVVGGTLVGIWGGPKRRRMQWVLLAVGASSLLGNVLVGVGRSVLVWGAGAFLAEAIMPIALGANQAIWQMKTPAHLQGRIFSARIVVTQLGATLALIAGGVLADSVFEPFMSGPSGFANALRPLVGSGPGAGIALMFVLAGLVGALAAAVAYFYRPVRDIETLLPDIPTPVGDAKAGD